MDCLIIGGTGSLGRALASRMLEQDAYKHIIIFSRGEHAQEHMAQDLNHLDAKGRLRFFVGDVRDSNRLRAVIKSAGIVIHAAAMKVVPKCEDNPIEAIKTNIGGAENVIDAAVSCGVDRVIAVSTDKSVSPNTLYGATKLCAEKMFTAANLGLNTSNTKFASVRYGNVCNSQGSVIPLWRSILCSGKSKVGVTSPFCTRFWITLAEAVDIITWTIKNMSGGEIVVPDMPAFEVSTLAEAMGAVPEIIGLRKGEKIHEDIINEHEYRDFRRVGPYWVSGCPLKGETLTEPMRSDRARRMEVDELRERLSSLRLAA